MFVFEIGLICWSEEVDVCFGIVSYKYDCIDFFLSLSCIIVKCLFGKILIKIMFFEK